MTTSILIALAAGFASALMFASVASGVAIALMLFYLAPLPLMVAALGWGPLAAVTGGSIASLGIGLAFGLPYLVAFAITVALPAWWLGHLALLARPVSNDSRLAELAPALDWYPVGRILAWVALFASITTVSAMFTLGTDAASIHEALRRTLTRIVSSGLDSANNPGTERAVSALIAIAPGAATLIAMLTLTFNLWLASKITSTSQQLQRPWPDLRMTRLPPRLLGVLAVTIALCFAGGLLAMIAQIVSAALLMAYGMTGFAVLHTVTQAVSGRSMLLGSLYAATVFIGWPLIGAVGLGLADAAFGIRERYWQRRANPPPPPTIT